MAQNNLEEFNPPTDFGIVSNFSSDAVALGDEFLTDIPKAEEIKPEEKEEKAKEIKKPDFAENKFLPEEDDSFFKTPEQKGEEVLEESEDTNKEETDKKENIPEEDTAENKFQIIANELFENGIFSLDEDEDAPEITSGEDLLEVFKYQKNKQAQQTIYGFLQDKHGEEGVKVFDAIFQKGVAPKEYLQQYVETESVANLSLEGEENISNQKKVMRIVYKAQGLEDGDIEAEITKLENYGDLEATAKRYHKAVSKREQDKLSRMEEEAENKAREEFQRTEYHKVAMSQILAGKLKQKTFDGIPVTEKVAQEALSALTKVAYKLPDGKPATTWEAYLYNLNHPDNYEKKVKLYLLSQLIEKDPTLEIIKKKGVSEKTDSAFSKLITQEKKVKHNNPLNTPSKGFLDGII